MTRDTNNNPTNLVDSAGLRPSDNGINSFPNTVGSGVPGNSSSPMVVPVPNINQSDIFPNIYGGGGPNASEQSQGLLPDAGDIFPNIYGGSDRSRQPATSWLSTVRDHTVLGIDAFGGAVDDVFIQGGSGSRAAYGVFASAPSKLPAGAAYVPSVRTTPNFYSASLRPPTGAWVGKALGGVGVVLSGYSDWTESKELGYSNTASAARTVVKGAAGGAGALAGAAAGIACGPFVFICSPVLGGVGAAAGGYAGSKIAGKILDSIF